MGTLPFLHLISFVHCNLCVPGVNGSLLLEKPKSNGELLFGQVLLVPLGHSPGPGLQPPFLYDQGDDPPLSLLHICFRISKGDEASLSSEAP